MTRIAILWNYFTVAAFMFAVMTAETSHAGHVSYNVLDKLANLHASQEKNFGCTWVFNSSDAAAIRLLF